MNRDKGRGSGRRGRRPEALLLVCFIVNLLTAKDIKLLNLIVTRMLTNQIVEIRIRV